MESQSAYWLGGRMSDHLKDIGVGFFGALFAAAIAMAFAWVAPEQFATWPLALQHLVFLLSWLTGAWVAMGARRDDRYFLHLLEVILLVLAGLLSAIFFRESLLRGDLAIEYAGTFVLAVVVIFVILWAPLHASQTDSIRDTKEAGSPNDATQYNSLSACFQFFWNRYSHIILSFAIPFFSIISLGDHLSRVWNSSAGPVLGISLSNAVWSARPEDSDIRNLFERIGSLFDLLQLPLQIVVIAVVVVIAWPKLEEIKRFISLRPTEVEVGHKLRKCAREAIDDNNRLNTLYPKSVNIFMNNVPKQWPIDSTGSNRALVKIFLSAEAGFSNAEALQKLLGSAEIALNDSIFLIYANECAKHQEENSKADEKEKKSEGHVLAYGTGSEWVKLIASQDFQRAMARADVAEITRIVDDARAGWLAKNPKDDFLLSTYSFDADMPLSCAIRHAGIRGLKRILLKSETVPQAYGILAMDDVGRFLYPANETFEDRQP